MIGKKIRNPRKSAGPGARVARLADYIDRPDAAPPNARAAKAERVEGLADYTGQPSVAAGREKCIYGGARGFQTASRPAQKAEMLALAQVSSHSKDPINHYVLSWREGEQPTPAQVEEAVDLFLDELGLAGHQTFYGLHADTDNSHLHLMVNRVHPLTRKAVEINKGFDLEALHRAVARIERAQGWRREANGRYRALADGTVERAGRRPAAGAARAPRAGEPHPSGEKSAWRVAADAGAPAIRAARSWAELHAGLAALGLRYERKGSGALLWVDATAVKASRAGRDCSLGAIERRLGPHRPAPPGLAAAARAPEPDRAGAPRFAEYRAARVAHFAGRRAESRAWRETRDAGRAALRAAQRAEREELFRAVPPGGGSDLNARRSLLAARHAAERAALQERLRRAQMRAGARWGDDFPSYEEWLAERDGTGARRRARRVALIVLEGEGPRPRDIRDFVAVAYARRVDYRRADDRDGPAAFVDRGREIEVRACRDRDTVRAALQLAAQKWGRFRVEGDAEYRALCAEVAAECGIALGNPGPRAALLPSGVPRPEQTPAP